MTLEEQLIANSQSTQKRVVVYVPPQSDEETVQNTSENSPIN